MLLGEFKTMFCSQSSGKHSLRCLYQLDAVKRILPHSCSTFYLFIYSVLKSVFLPSLAVVKVILKLRIHPETSRFLQSRLWVSWRVCNVGCTEKERVTWKCFSGAHPADLQPWCDSSCSTWLGKCSVFISSSFKSVFPFWKRHPMIDMSMYFCIWETKRLVYWVYISAFEKECLSWLHNLKMLKR